MAHHNRKRSRDSQEDEVEFMPLSKRINNLHINTSLLLNKSSASLNAVEWGPGPPNYNNACLPDSPPSSVQSLDWNMPQYTPDLNESQNPHYFNINKLLFEMYIARAQRGCNV